MLEHVHILCFFLFFFFFFFFFFFKSKQCLISLDGWISNALMLLYVLCLYVYLICDTIINHYLLTYLLTMYTHVFCQIHAEEDNL